MKPRELAATIRGGDATKLTRMPGVGKKTAKRMVLELKDKLAEFGVVRRRLAPDTHSKTMCSRRSSTSATSPPLPRNPWNNSAPPTTAPSNNSSAPP